MEKREWAEEALRKLQADQTAQVRPRGHSMESRISDGELVTLEPCRARDLKVGDIVLARIRGRRYSHLVLHQLLGRVGWRYLIGNDQGRRDGWVSQDDIFGKVTKIGPSDAHYTERHSSLKDEAEFYRIAIPYGLCSMAETIAWCDSIIEAEEVPDIAIIEASLLGRQLPHHIVSKLAEVPGRADLPTLKRRLFGAMHELLLQDRTRAPLVTKCLWDIANEYGDLPAIEEPEMWNFYDELDLAQSGVVGDAERITDELIRFLEMRSAS